MGLWDVLTGRRKPVEANLDVLFAVPQAALSLQVNGFTPLGTGAVCYRANEGVAFTETQSDVQALLDADGGPAVERSTDSYGFTWLLDRQDPDDDIGGLVTELHAVNTTLQDNGFGPSLLCSLIGFRAPSGAPLGLVYLYKRGTFYPFVPQGDQRRDNVLELQVRGLVSGDLPVESELGRWLGVWGAPGLG